MKATLLTTLLSWSSCGGVFWIRAIPYVAIFSSQSSNNVSLKHITVSSRKFPMMPFSEKKVITAKIVKWRLDNLMKPYQQQKLHSTVWDLCDLYESVYV